MRVLFQTSIDAGQSGVAKLLLKIAQEAGMCKTIANHVDETKSAPLHVAARYGDMRCLMILLEVSGLCWVWSGLVLSGLVLSGVVWCLVWSGVWSGLVLSGVVWCCLVALVRSGVVYCGAVWLLGHGSLPFTFAPRLPCSWPGSTVRTRRLWTEKAGTVCTSCVRLLASMTSPTCPRWTKLREGRHRRATSPLHVSCWRDGLTMSWTGMVACGL